LAEFNDIAIATLEAYHDDLADAIHNGSPTYSFLKEQGLVMTQATEGPSFVRPILARDTAEPLWFRYADEHSFVPSDTTEGARFRWYNVRLPIAVTEEELKENQGISKRLDLLGLKVRAAELTLRDRFNKALVLNRSCYVYKYGGNSANLPDPIPKIIGLTPGAATLRVSYGEINRSTPTPSAPWWRGQAYSASTSGVAGNSYTGWRNGLQALYFNCSRDGFKPGLLLCNQEGYIKMGRVLEHFNSKQVAVPMAGGLPAYEGGWEGLMWYGAQVRWDPDILGLHGGGASNEGVIFMLNKDFWGFIEDNDWNWLLLPFEGPKGNQTQLIRQSYIVHRCGMYHDNPRFCGCFYAMSVNPTAS